MCEIHNLLVFARFKSVKWKETTREKTAVLKLHAVAFQRFLRKLGFKHRWVQERTISLRECRTQEPLRRGHEYSHSSHGNHLQLQLKRCRGNGFDFLVILHVQVRLVLSLFEQRHHRSPTLEVETSKQKRINFFSAVGALQYILVS